MNRLTQPINRFEGTTSHEPRPSRHIARYRYLGEGELTRLCDEWDESELSRQYWAREGARVDADIAARKAADARAQKEREDELLDGELKRRYLSGGGTESGFVSERGQLRRDFARKVALGEAQPLMSSVEQLKQQLKAARLGRNLSAAPDPRTTATDDA